MPCYLLSFSLSVGEQPVGWKGAISSGVMPVEVQGHELWAPSHVAQQSSSRDLGAEEGTGQRKFSFQILPHPEHSRHTGGGNVVAPGLDPTLLPIFPMTQLSSILLWLASGEFES